MGRRLDQLTEVATRYYIDQQSQTRIARELGLDPSTVSRLLKRARAEGIVRVEIVAPRHEDSDLGRLLAQRLGLARVVVAAAADDPDNSLSPVAAEFIAGLLRSGLRLGVSWGKTLAGVVGHLRPGIVAGLHVAQLAGGVDDPTPGFGGHELVRRVAELYPGSRVSYLHAPAILGSAGARDALLADRTVATALSAARRSQVALVGIGEMDATSTMFRGGHVERSDWTRLKAAGAVGNMNTRFFDAAGRPVELLEARTIAVSWAELRKVTQVIAIAAGLGKVDAIRAAAATGCVDTLVTDQETARALL